MSDGFTTWQHPYRNTQIHVHPQVVKSLAAQALQAAKQESEIGGVLWGQTGSDDSIMIMDATLVPSSGPLFNVGARDARDIAQALSGRGPKASVSLAGFFRSYIRDGLCLTPQDQTVISQQVRDPDAVFMVIKPFAIGVCTAGLFFWRDGRLQIEDSDLEVPFMANDEASHKSPEPPPEPVRPVRERPAARTFDEQPVPDPIAPSTKYFEQRSTPGAPPVPAPHEEPQIVAMLRESALRNAPAKHLSGRQGASGVSFGKDEEKRSAQPRLLLIAAVVCLFAIITGTGLYYLLPTIRSMFQGPPEHPPSAHINLQVTRAANGQLDLNWDRTAPDVTRAASATLYITDGRASHKLKLDNEQLRSGKLMYFAKSDDVQFQLELNTDSLHTVAESVRVLLPASEARRAKRSLTERGGPGAKTAELTPGVTASSADPDIAAYKKHAPEQGESTAANKLKPAPQRPPLSLVPSVVTASSGTTGAQVTPAGTFVPPQVVEEMMPETAPMGQFAQVSVEVNIDQTGRVTTARPVDDGSVSSAQLTAIATAAAQRWRFSPATLNGKPVPSQYRIVFAFHRPLP